MSVRTLSTGLWGLAPRRTFGVELGAVGAALLLHAGFLLVRNDVRPAAAFTDYPLIAVLIDAQPEPVALPEPPAPAEPAPPDSMPAPSFAQTALSTTPTLAAGPVSDAPPAEAAAPLATSADPSSDWEMVSGSGTALGRGGLGRPSGAGGVGRVTTLAPRDFSREAQAPALQPYVDRNFPSIAGMYKVDGDVTVSALINPEGVPSDLRVESVDPGGRGFGESCSRSVLQGPRWKPKLNRDGRPVPARVTYRCKFRLPEDAKNAGVASSGTGANRVWSHSAGD